MRPIIVHAFDANHEDPSTGHRRIDVEVRHEGRVIFPRGATWCAVNRWTTVDGVEARELVLSLVGMKPGDTDQEYFASYTEEQLAFAERWGELISNEREARYCDPETGAVRVSEPCHACDRDRGNCDIESEDPGACQVRHTCGK